MDVRGKVAYLTKNILNLINQLNLSTNEKELLVSFPFNFLVFLSIQAESRPHRTQCGGLYGG